MLKDVLVSYYCVHLHLQRLPETNKSLVSVKCNLLETKANAQAVFSSAIA